ncbi:MAG: TIGR02453 family protein [Rhodocyclaceae bacterium]|nr:TIGR02453 family protein [Rhodocyclaceae bacterium]
MDSDDRDWPGTAIAYLSDLAENNNRPWFDGGKHRYRETVAEPAARCLDEMKVLLEGAIGCPMDGRIFRLARDMRFARPGDPPYHTWLRMAFRARDRATGCYLSIEPAGVRFGVGLIAFDKTQLTAWRDAVAGVAGHTLAPVERHLIGAGWRIDPPELRRLPSGVDADGAPARWLRHKQFSAWRDADGSRFRSRRDLQSWCVAAADDARPLSDWLAQHLPAGHCAGRPGNGA